MAKGGKVACRPNMRRKVRSKYSGSDDSDEDYIGEDEDVQESDEYVSPFDGDESEERLGEFEGEEEEQEHENTEKADFCRKGASGRKIQGVKKQGKKRRASYTEEDDEDYDYDDEEEVDDEEFEEDEEEDQEPEKTVKKVGFGLKGDSGRKIKGARNPGKKMRASYKEEDDDDYEYEYSDDDEDNDDDEEFMLDGTDYDDEDEVPVIKKNKNVGRPRLRQNSAVKGRKRKTNHKRPKRPKKKKPRKNHRLSRKASSNNREFIDKSKVLEDKRKKISDYQRRLVANSDSDFVSSESSDFDYTISEEEREQIREATEFCNRSNTSLRTSNFPKRLQEEIFCQKKCARKKGKEKVNASKNEVGKQVCGICLSEEGKKSVPGTLNCCSHYFCFACIMEWSKVESRCPLCKQRFVTISKPTKSNKGFDLRNVEVQVPERDQVYQPSEEELRGYLDPYESVICTECQQGGDDALMLLCDLCDSPAHTYCVGLGHEVPEGNWYCEGCRPTALGSSSPHGLHPTPDQRTSNNISGRSSPADNVRVPLDLNEMYVPDTPLTQETGDTPSPRFSVGDFQAASPASGSGAYTVSDRRRIQRQIHHIIQNRMRQPHGQSYGISTTNWGNSPFGSEIGRGRESGQPHSITLERGRELFRQHTIATERVASRYAFSEGRFQDNSSHLVHNRDHFFARQSHSREPVIQNSTSTFVDGMLPAELARMDAHVHSRLGSQQLRPCSSRSAVGSDATVSPHAFREVRHSNVEKDRVQSLVRSHLKSFSTEMGLDYRTFKDVARSSTHTILAACGLEHRTSEVCTVPVGSPPSCNHIDRMGGEQPSVTKGYCSSCFDSFARNVIRTIINNKNASVVRV